VYEATQRYYDANAEVIAQVLGRHFNAALISRSDELDTCLADDLEYIIDAAGLEDGQAVLEGGPGNGYFCRRLLQRLPGIRYCGIEVSSRQVAVARRVNPGVDFREASYEELDFPQASFDRALFLESIGYCIDLDRLLQRLHHVLKPGGRVFVKNPGQKIIDYHDFLSHARYFDRVRREYGFDERSLGIIPDIDFLLKKFRLHGFELAREAYPYFNEYFYNAAFYAPAVSRPVHRADRTTITFDFTDFDPARSLTPLGRSHPEYVAYHRQLGAGYRPRNRLINCVVLVFERLASRAETG